jgi:PST family polysaccharide transporter
MAMTDVRHAANTEGPSLGHRVVVGAGWMVALRWIDRLIGLVSVAILARLLLPEHFGIVGYAMLVVGMLELFGGIATEAALIREHEADDAYYSAAWTMNVLKGVLFGALTIALAHPAAGYFREPALAAIMYAVAAIPLIQGLVNVGTVDFRKHLRFSSEFQLVLLARIPSMVATIALAFALRSYWALVAGSIFRAALQVVLSYWLHPFRARFTFVRMPEIFRFSRWMMLQNLAAGFNEKLPAFIVGREWGSSALAFFNMGREIAALATTEIRAPIRRALFPGLAQVARQPARLNAALVDSTGMLALLSLPIPLGIGLVAEDLVPLLLGAQWQPLVPILQPLCVGAAIYALGTNSHLAYLVFNRAYLTAGADVIRLLLLVPALIVVAPTYGVEGVAYTIAGVSCVMVAADYVLSPRILGIDTGRFVAAVWRPVAASMAMCIVVWLAGSGFAPATDLAGHAAALARSMSVGAVTYVGGVLTLWFIAGRPDGAERRLVSLITEYRDRRRRT